MGVVKGIGYDEWPRQGDMLGRRCEVLFGYARRSPGLFGTIVRDDMAAPFETIIRLDDGRHVRAVECQYMPMREGDLRDAAERSGG